MANGKNIYHLIDKHVRGVYPASILYTSIAGLYWPVSYPDGLITACYRFIKNAGWVIINTFFLLITRTLSRDMYENLPTLSRLHCQAHVHLMP